MEVLEILDRQKKVLTVREIASQDVRNAEVFKRFGIEICCGGIMSLEAACLHLKLDLLQVENELIKARGDEKKPDAIDLDSFNAHDLAKHIYNKYHVAFYKENTLILDLLNRVQSHVKQYPVLKEVNRLYLDLQRDLINSFAQKENGPFTGIIEALQLIRSSSDQVPVNVTGIFKEVELMRAFHTSTTGILEDLRTVTNDFIAPEVACNSFKLLYHKLKGLEEDLLSYMDLLDQIFFPKVIALSRATRTN
jgi:regulator of cell morphogenesis and NO signaling